MAVTTIFRDIDELITLSPAAEKQGRGVTAADLGVLKRAAIVSVGGRIQWVGPRKNLPRQHGRVREVSFGGRTVMPSFVEAHTHLIFAGDRQDEFEKRNGGVSYQQIAREGGGILSTVRATRKASLSELTRLGQVRAERFVAQGVTTLECKSGYGLDLQSELKLLKAVQNLKGPRCISTFMGAHALAPEFSDYEAYLEFLTREVLPVVARRKLARRVDIFIDEGYFSVAGSRKYLRRAQELGLEVVVHAEQLGHTGASQLAVELGARSADHLVQITGSDAKVLANSNATAVLLPVADFYLRMKYPPARELLDAGARVALATDFNPGSSPTQDLSLVGVLGRLEMKMSLPEVIAAYTISAAHALGLADQVGSLDINKFCDLVVLDGYWSELFYQVGYHPVHQVWREGALLFKKS